MTEPKTKKPRQTFKQLKEEIDTLQKQLDEKDRALELLRGMVNALTIQNQELVEGEKSKPKGWWRSIIG